MQLTNSWNHFIAFTVKSNIFEQEQMEEEQNVEDRNISCKVLLGEGNEVCCCLCVCARACVHVCVPDILFYGIGLSSLWRTI